MAHKIMFYLWSCNNHDWFFRFCVLSTNIMSAISPLKLQWSEPSLKLTFSKQKWEIIPSVWSCDQDYFDDTPGFTASFKLLKLM